MDFKATYFDTLNLRNQLMAKLGALLVMPKKLDDLSFMNSAMLKSKSAPVKENAAILQTRIGENRKAVDDEIVVLKQVSSDIIDLKTAIENNPALTPLIAGETSLFTFAIDSILKQKIVDYIPLFNKALAYSKQSVAALKEFERIDKSMATLEKNINDTYKSSLSLGAVPSLAELEASKSFQISDVPAIAWVGAGLLAAVTVIPMAVKIFRRKNKEKTL